MTKRRAAAVSILEEEYASAKARASALGLNFSAYVTALIRADIKKGGNFTMEPAVRVICEGIAEQWAARAGFNRVECESWYGSKLYAEGIYDGPVPEAYAARIFAEAAAKAQREIDDLQLLKNSTFAEVETIHGPVKSKDAATDPQATCQALARLWSHHSALPWVRVESWHGPDRQAQATITNQ